MQSGDLPDPVGSHISNKPWAFSHFFFERLTVVRRQSQLFKRSRVARTLDKHYVLNSSGSRDTGHLRFDVGRAFFELDLAVFVILSLKTMA